MLKLVVCVITVTAVCCAQEHLTCLRTDNVLTQPSPVASQRALQGSPGKRGPKGQVGSRGYPGQKGEPGTIDNRQIKSLRDQIDFLSQKVETLTNQSKKIQLEEQVNFLIQEVLKNQSRKEYQKDQSNSLSQEVKAVKNQSRENRRILDVISKGLYLHIPPYVYEYQLTPGLQSWQTSRQYCQNWGGDLAVHGVKTKKDRKKLLESLSINFFVWIGANDIATEGNFTWVNGERASTSELIWLSGQPSGYNHDCIYMYGSDQGSNAGLAGDYKCVQSDRGLCEKKL